ncbi:MAG: deoxyribose-phosphate aldolase [Armatimonadota bacterium]|nr:deoxyribose-phosphate aldolase [Armatimonadota bacterium]MDR7402180.1 deoxyribose-phosphate aldolase [Armatimonadota bacterium]MDR7404630.1 deoxyribose-phosphate aldolase [Armatimonadota bacterium]MDR7436937.1 deoxyribose-phosphate aldolase [Armatimonadota bacterium]MDR7472289.1 deoxyribose-phosphate aldolase [Armatimonadota bacterium]
MTPAELARRIEHAVLGPQTTAADAGEAAGLARRWGVRALVVKPCYVPVAVRALEGSPVRVVTVVGFPHGGQTTEAKVAEARQAVAQGAAEVDMVINIGALRERDLGRVFYDIRAVVEAAGRPVKVILETGYLTDAEKRLGARLAARAGAAYVKTSTGFGPAGATVADVALLRRIVPRSVGVKAAGGIRSYRDALALLDAGADLLGTSATEAILQEAAAHAA